MKSKLTILISLFLLSSCASRQMDLENNRRMPLYNKKYIKKAKTNIANTEEYIEESQENFGNKHKNKQAYSNMLKNENMKNKENESAQYSKLKSELSSIKKCYKKQKKNYQIIIVHLQMTQKKNLER